MEASNDHINVSADHDRKTFFWRMSQSDAVLLRLPVKLHGVQDTALLWWHKKCVQDHSRVLSLVPIPQALQHELCLYLPTAYISLRLLQKRSTLNLCALLRCKTRPSGHASVDTFDVLMWGQAASCLLGIKTAHMIWVNIVTFNPESYCQLHAGG